MLIVWASAVLLLIHQAQCQVLELCQRTADGFSCVSSGQRPSCQNPELYSVREDCGCLHWHCALSTDSFNISLCPTGWKQYTTSEGSALCLLLINQTQTWTDAAKSCDQNFNSDLFDVRKFEDVTERNSRLKREIITDLSMLTDNRAHWSGLHVDNGKLYWDSEIPSPDRDLTSARYPGYSWTQSQSIVKFTTADWNAISTGRTCMSFNTRINSGAELAVMVPIECSARLPYICFKLPPNQRTDYFTPSTVSICEPGWSGSLNSGKCYRYFPSPASFDKALDTCNRNNAFLVDPRNSYLQGFAFGLLSKQQNGSSPVAIHAAMRVLEDSTVNFLSNDRKSISIDELGQYPISRPERNAQACGMLLNPEFARNLEIRPAEFGDCGAERPYICWKDITEQKVKSENNRLSLTQDGFTLTCRSSGLDVYGRIFWKKDHEYFPNQYSSAVLQLNSSVYNYMIGDMSNRSIPSSELTGSYTCEFWQAFPKRIFASEDLSVVTDDSIALRLNAALLNQLWSPELDGFNYRVSQSDELTPELLRIQNTVEQDVLTTLSGGGRQTVMQPFTVNLIALRKTEENTVMVKYRVVLSGPQIRNALSSHQTVSDDDYLTKLIAALSNNTLESTDRNLPNGADVHGQLLCLATDLTHNQTKEVLHLPITVSPARVSVSGHCHSEPKVMVTADCKYDKELRSSFWDGLSYTDCPSDCTVHTVSHQQMAQTFQLGSGIRGDRLLLNGTCNGINQPLIEATCGSPGRMDWHIEPLDCKAFCVAHTLSHPQLNTSLPLQDVPIGETFTYTSLCGTTNITSLMAQCVGSLRNGGNWTNVSTQQCAPVCAEQRVQHPQTAENWTIPESSENAMIELTGFCSGSEMTLLHASCIASNHRADWELNFTSCQARCPKFERPSDISDQVFMLPDGFIGDVFEVYGNCVGKETVLAKAFCDGSAAIGGRWRIEERRCEICRETDFTHPPTLTKLSAKASNAREIRHLVGFCQGKQILLMTVECQQVAPGEGMWNIHYIAECKTNVEQQFQNLLQSFKDNPKELSKLAANMTVGLTRMSQREANALTDIMEFIARPETPKSVEVEGRFFISIVNNVMNMQSVNASGWNANKTTATTATTARMIKSVDQFLETAQLNENKTVITRDNIHVEVWNATSEANYLHIGIKVETSEINLSPSIAAAERVAFVRYASSAMFTSDSTLLGDTILSASVNGKTVNSTDGAVQFSITCNHTAPVRCAFWNFQESVWSTAGCKQLEESGDTITCSCDHLTNFAIVVDIAGQQDSIPEEHEKALSIISTVGLSLSIAALCLHLISFAFISKLRSNQFQKVLANLATAILFSDLVFIFGMERGAENHAACIAVAALLHYFILASFAWMFVEAFMQYRRFVKVFKTHISRLMLKVAIPAWLIPALPGAILLAISPELYRGGDHYCWMKPVALYYTMLLPIGTVIVANAVLFVLIVRALTCARPTNLRTNKSERHMAAMYLKAAVAIFSLLGLTWLFGFLAIRDSRLVFQYLFCIFNTSQGLVIFLLHNIRDPKVQSWWRRVLHLKAVLPQTSTVQSTRITTNSSKLSISENYAREAPGLQEREVGGIDRRDQLKISKVMHSSTESDNSKASESTTQSGGTESSLF